jgi:predicted dehydrogenase
MGSISRRSFLKSSAALTAAASMSGVSGAAGNDRIRVAVIGLNNRGPQVASSFLDSKQFEIVTLCDCDTAMFEKGMGELRKKGFEGKPKLEQDFRKVLEDKNVDAIINATQDHWHAMMTILALEAGKHVYLEKPASYNIVDGKAIVAAAEKHPKLTVLVGTQRRSAKHYKEACEFVQSGALGKIAFCRTWVTHRRKVLEVIPDSEPPKTLDYDMWLGPAPKRPYNANRVHYNWRFVRDYGTGEMANFGAHAIDIVPWYLGLDYPKSVTGYGGQYVTHDAKEWPDTQTILYEYPDLTVLWEQRLWTQFEPYNTSCGTEFGGEKGSLVVSGEGWTFYPAEGGPQKHGGSEMDVSHAAHFAECIRGNAKPSSGALEGHKTAVLCHLGNIVVTVNRRLEFDGATQAFKNDAEANALLSRPYRAPWKLPA